MNDQQIQYLELSGDTSLQDRQSMIDCRKILFSSNYKRKHRIPSVDFRWEGVLYKRY